MILVLVACKDSEDRSCFKSVGDLGYKEVTLESFDKLYLGPHLKYVLVQDTVNKAVIYGGENLLNFIETTIDEEKRLNIRNNNKCNFLRDYDKVVTVEIHVKKISNILFEGTYELSCSNVLVSDYMTLVIRDGAGAVNLNLDAYELWTTVTYGWGNFNFSGNVKYLNLNIDGNGFGSANNLQVADSLHVISNTPEVLQVNADNCIFRAQTLSSGDIWYVGTPSSVTFDTYGTGSVLDKN